MHAAKPPDNMSRGNAQSCNFVLRYESLADDLSVRGHVGFASPTSSSTCSSFHLACSLTFLPEHVFILSSCMHSHLPARARIPFILHALSSTCPSTYSFHLACSLTYLLEHVFILSSCMQSHLPARACVHMLILHAAVKVAKAYYHSTSVHPLHMPAFVWHPDMPTCR